MHDASTLCFTSHASILLSADFVDSFSYRVESSSNQTRIELESHCDIGLIIALMNRCELLTSIPRPTAAVSRTISSLAHHNAHIAKFLSSFRFRRPCTRASSKIGNATYTCVGKNLEKFYCKHFDGFEAWHFRVVLLKSR